MQPHKQAVTQLQHFELDGQVAIMSGSADWTIAMCTITGERIGTFNGKGPHWTLAKPSEWCSMPPVLDDAPRPTEEDEGGLSLSLRRPGKATGRRFGADQGSARLAGSPGITGLRAPRAAQFSRPVASGNAHREGIYQKIKAVERNRPESAIYRDETQYLLTNERKYRKVQ